MLDYNVVTFLYGVAFGGFVAGGVFWFMGLNYGRAEGTKDLIETYKHLLTYGQVNKPKAAVREAAPGPEERVLAEISATSITNLTEHLAKAAGVSNERAREEAERLTAQFETYGTPPD
jgi:hypothetical protein